MNTKMRPILVAAMLIVAALVGASAILVGAQAPRTKPQATPTPVVPTPVPIPTDDLIPGTAVISGQVWHDLCSVAGGEDGVPLSPSAGCVPDTAGGYKANGLPETGEPGIGGVLIQLGAGACPASGLATTTTDTGGAYAFSGLDAGTYCVSADVSSPQNASLLPGLWTSPLVGADGNVTGQTVALLEGEHRSGVSLGWDYELLPVPEPVSPEPSPVPACTDRAAFVSDVTVPDNTRLSPGQSFVKTWRLRNTGTCTWSTDYALVFASAGGHKMGGPDSVPLRGAVEPGQTVDISVTLTAPAGNGTYVGKWQLRNSDGDLFGTGSDAKGVFWVRIIVGPTFTGWRGDYYGNRNLTGDPVLTRDDAAGQGLGINFDWGNNSPATGVPADGFSARWTRSLSFQAGTYYFYAHSDDGVRVWLDGELIIDQWREASGATYTAERTLSAGTHTLRIEYYENVGGARIRFWWEQLGEFSQWRGEYFPNTGLSGAPKLTRNDPAINFSWGRSAPATGLPEDAFSVRWRRVLMFEAGTYRFRAQVDDGVRLWVDGVLVIDAWAEGAAREVTADYRLSAGNHTVRVEYLEVAGEAQIQVTWDKLPQYPDWKGEYWSNRRLSGTPILVRNDQVIDFQWGSASPAAGLPVDDFSARWTRTAGFEVGQYRFYAIVDDGVRVYVDDVLVIDEWRDGERRGVESSDVGLAAGNHQVRVEYYEHGGQALIQVWWTKVASPTYPDWKGEYWSNRDLRGTPTLTRNDRVIDFQWGSGAPAVGLPADGFSARWVRKVTFQSGVYRLQARADDGIRVYVDGTLVLNEWHANDGDQVYTVDLTLRDQHRLVVEYYERDGRALAKFWWRKIGDWPTPTPAPNRRPVAANDTAITDEDTRVYVNVLANDSDPDGDALTVSNYQAVSTKGGTVSCTTAGVCAYMPRTNFNRTDTFTYTISDGKGHTATATVTVTVNPVNDPPVAANDIAITDEDTRVYVNVLANDSDPDGDALTVSNYQAASTQGGTVSCTTAGVCTYVPALNFSSTDTFTYTASDGKGGTASATVTVTVNPVNDPPVAVDDVAVTDVGITVAVNVLANDSDPDGDALTVSDYQATSASGGVVNCTIAGVCTYAPSAGFSGADTFTYTISDGKGGTASATVTVTVSSAPAPEMNT